MLDFFADLRVRLLLLVSLVLLPILCLTVYTNREERRLAVIEAQLNALGLARLAANEQESLIEGARQLLFALAHLPSVQNYDAAECSLFLDDLLEHYPLYENLGAVHPDGDIFCSAIQGVPTPNVADRSWFQRALQTRDFVAGDYIIARITGKPTLSTAYPVLDGAGGVRAVVFAGIDLNWLDNWLDKHVTGAQMLAGSTVSVVDHAGTILTRYPDRERWRGKSLLASTMQSLIAQGEAVGEAEGVDGVPRLYGATRLCCLQGGDIFVRVGIPKAVAFAEANRMLTRNLITLGLVTLLCFAVAWGGGHLFVLRPVNVLLKVIEQFDAGDFGARVGWASGGGQLGQLARAFDQMAATVEVRNMDRNRSEEALRLHGTRAEALATTAAQLNGQFDPQSMLDMVCRETAGALQLSAASVSLYDEKLDALHCVSHCGLPEDFGERIDAQVEGTWRQQLKRGEVVVFPEVQAHPELSNASLFAALDIRTFVGTPMMHEGRLLGSLCAFALGQERQFAEDELAFLKAMSDQAAQAITNACLYEALRQEQRSRAALLDKTISAQEDERKRIARELHDQTSQDLAALLLSLDSCTLSLTADRPRFEQHLQTAKSIANTMLTSIYRLINDLRPPLLDDLGLGPAILWYGEQRLEPLDIALEFQCDRMEARLPPPLETALFRIAQEALTNVVRHADATRVIVTLEVNELAAFVTVEDNGTGFQIPATASGETEEHGLGLRGIEERVTTLGGELHIQSAPGQGTIITVKIPLLKEERTGG